jgi:biotin transport system substrate-specific component
MSESRSLPLANALFPTATPQVVRAIVLIGVAVALMTLSAKVQVPFWPVPVTLQTLVVPLIGAAYGSRMGLVAMVAYLAAGFAGAPVFAGTPPAVAGPLYFVGPTGGYLIGYPIAAFLIGWLAERGADRNPVALFGAMLAGGAVVFALGFAWLAFAAQLSSGATGLGATLAWEKGVLPFILADVVKAGLAAALITVGARFVGRLRG